MRIQSLQEGQERSVHALARSEKDKAPHMISCMELLLSYDRFLYMSTE